MTLTARDQSDLMRYFSMGYMEKSPSGPTLERAWLYATESSMVESDRITARITSEVRIAAKAEPHLDDLELIGRVSRKLAMLSVRNRKALEAFHGDRGARCAVQVEKHGRIVSLFDLTPGGRALAKRERMAAGKPKAKGKTTAELIDAALARQGAPDDEQAAAVAPTIGLALKQSLDLKEQAEEAYTAASERVKLDRKKVPAGPKLVRREMRDEDL